MKKELVRLARLLGGEFLERRCKFIASNVYSVVDFLGDVVVMDGVHEAEFMYEENHAEETVYAVVSGTILNRCRAIFEADSAMWLREAVFKVYQDEHNAERLNGNSAF